jgi:Asp-tRNA(Asn)/Glu-tRNA(Gln) amidotransferase A subunit family amidase
MRTVCAAAQASLLKSIQQNVASKQQSAVEVTQAYLQQLKSVEGQVQSFLTVNEEHALAQVSLQELAAVWWAAWVAVGSVIRLVG